jgi:tyrosine-protein kinase Etk/Wzc
LESGRLDLYRLVFIVSKWRRFIVKTTVLVCIITTIVLLLLPNWYTATTSVLPPERETSFMGLASSLLQGVGFLGGQEMILPAFATPSHVYASILKSRTVVESIVNEYDLKTRYKSGTIEDAMKECLSHTRVKVGPEGFVTLSFEDTDRKRAADIANGFITLLNKINSEVSSSRARNTRVFLDERLAEAQQSLQEAEDTLRSFQEENRAISLNAQMEAQIENVAELEGALAMAEIELGLLKRTLTSGHPEILRKQMEIAEVKRKISELNLGVPGSDDYGTVALPFAQVPRLALEFGRLLREVKIQETLFGLLTEQHEHAKIQEAKDTPTIQILDFAQPPEKKSRPKRLIILAIAAGLSVVFSMLYAAAAESLEQLKETRPRDWQMLKDGTSHVRDDLVYLWHRVRGPFRRER